MGRKHGILAGGQVQRQKEDGILFKAPSICVGCGRSLIADVAESGGKVYTVKSCDSCGRSDRVLAENDARFYKRMVRGFIRSEEPLDTPLELVGESKRQVLLFFLTKRCNSACSLCLTDNLMGRSSLRGREVAEPTLAEFERILDAGNVRGKEVIFYGGEPTVRDDFPDFIRAAKARGNRATAYTNGRRLADPAYARALKEAGLDWALVSLDTLSGGVSSALKGADMVGEKLAAVRNLAREGIRVVITPTIAAGYNDEEIGKLIEFAVENRALVGQVMLRPMMNAGKVGIRSRAQLTSSDVIRRIEEQTEGRVRESHFASFMRMRKAALGAVGRIWGEDAARRFMWGTGYSLLLKVRADGEYGPYLSEREMDEASGVLEGALAQKGGAAFAAKITSGLPKLLSRGKLRLAVGTIGAGTDRLGLIDRMMGMGDVLQLHVTDHMTYVDNLQGGFHINTHVALKRKRSERSKPEWEFKATSPT